MVRFWWTTSVGLSTCLWPKSWAINCGSMQPARDSELFAVNWYSRIGQIATRSSALSRTSGEGSCWLEEAGTIEGAVDVVVEFSCRFDEVWLATDGGSEGSCEDIRFTNSVLDMHWPVLLFWEMDLSTLTRSGLLNSYILSLSIICSNWFTFIVSVSASPNCLNSLRTKYSAGWCECSCSSRWWCPACRLTRITASFRADIVSGDALLWRLLRSFDSVLVASSTDTTKALRFVRPRRLLTRYGLCSKWRWLPLGRCSVSTYRWPAIEALLRSGTKPCVLVVSSKCCLHGRWSAHSRQTTHTAIRCRAMAETGVGGNCCGWRRGGNSGHLRNAAYD